MSRKIPTRKVVQEIKDILTYSKIFKKVNISKNISLTQEDTFPSCYIKVEGTSAELNGNIGTTEGCEYDRVIILRLLIFLDMQDELEFLDYQDDVEKAIITDNPLWKIVLDRDFIGSEWDSDTSYPKKEGELAFLLKWRSDV